LPNLVCLLRNGALHNCQSPSRSLLILLVLAILDSTPAAFLILHAHFAATGCIFCLCIVSSHLSCSPCCACERVLRMFCEAPEDEDEDLHVRTSPGLSSLSAIGYIRTRLVCILTTTVNLSEGTVRIVDRTHRWVGGHPHEAQRLRACLRAIVLC